VSEPALALVVLSLAGAAAEALALALLFRARPAALLVSNYRGATVIGRAGLTLVVPLLAAATLAWATHAAPGPSGLPVFAATIAALIFGALGWLDDTYGDSTARGMKGHLEALAKHRRVTTGLVKAVGGGAVGLWAAYVCGASGWAVLPAGALVAVSANSVNVLDARPGRAVKGFVLASVIVLVLGCRAPLPGALAILASLIGGAVVFAWADLGERAMLGDTGANSLGCVLGIAVLGLTSWPVWVALSVVLAVLCLAADRWSLSRLIDSAPVLRWIDELGRPGGAAGRGSHGD